MNEALTIVLVSFTAFCFAALVRFGLALLANWMPVDPLTEEDDEY